MPDYEPTSRRPIATIFRRTANHAVQLCVRAGVHPDTISYASMVAAAFASASFLYSMSHPFLLIAGALFCILRLWFNMLDGMVALASGKASRRGEFINEAPDRVSDVIIFVGVAHSGLANPYLGYWTAIAALLIAYVATLGQAIGVHRDFSGIMSKQWRMVALSIGAVISCAALYASANGAPTTSLGLTILDWTLILILAGGAQTLVKRVRNIFRALDNKPRTGQDT